MTTYLTDQFGSEWWNDDLRPFQTAPRPSLPRSLKPLVYLLYLAAGAMLAGGGYAYWAKTRSQESLQRLNSEQSQLRSQIVSKELERAELLKARERADILQVWLDSHLHVHAFIQEVASAVEPQDGVVLSTLKLTMREVTQQIEMEISLVGAERVATVLRRISDLLLDAGFGSAGGGDTITEEGITLSGYYTFPPLHQVTSGAAQTQEVNP